MHGAQGLINESIKESFALKLCDPAIGGTARAL